MKLLLVKTSSLGDLVHTLPALTDARRHHPSLRVTWVVEEAYTEIPPWHEAVEHVVPVAGRRWRRDLAAFRTEIGPFLRALRRRRYNHVIDAQGLIKSALLTALARGPGAGYDRHSAREAPAAAFYRRRHPVAPERHAIHRTRCLFAAALGYETPHDPPDFGIRLPQHEAAAPPSPAEPYLVFLHGTTWATKHWPPSHWSNLAALACEAGYRVFLSWGNDEERRRAAHIAGAHERAEPLPPLSLTALAHVLAGARGVVTLDTGLGHLAAALGTPCVGLYGATDAARAGLTGRRAWSLIADLPCAPCRQRVCTLPERDPDAAEPPCMHRLDAGRTWERLQNLIEN